MSKFLLATLILLLAFGTSSIAQANLLINGDFETGDFTGWSVLGTGVLSSNSTANPQYGTHHARITSGSLDWFRSDGKFQDVAVTVGQQYRLTGYAYVPNGSGVGEWWAKIDLQFIGFIDGTWYELDGWHSGNMKTLPRDQYNLADTGWITAPSDTEIARISFGTWAIQDEQPVSPIDFDSFDFSPIPEPASLLLLSSGLIGLVAFTRKQKG